MDIAYEKNKLDQNIILDCLFILRLELVDKFILQLLLMFETLFFVVVKD